MKNRIKRLWVWLHLPPACYEAGPADSLQLVIDKAAGNWRPAEIRLGPGVYNRFVRLRPFVRVVLGQANVGVEGFSLTGTTEEVPK